MLPYLYTYTGQPHYNAIMGSIEADRVEDYLTNKFISFFDQRQ